MPKFTPYAVAALPTTGIDINGIYFKKGGGDTKFYISIRKNDNSDWIHLGTMNSVDEVNGLTGDVQIDLAFNTVTGVLSLTGSAVTVDLDARYRKKSDNVPWAEISGKPTTLSGYGITDGALDSAVVHNTGNETIAGTKTYSSSPVIPDGTNANHAASKGQMDTADASLQTQINNLTTTVNEGIKVPTDINCAANPNYPASTKGDSYRVTAAGKIGGASGIDVAVGDQIICKTTSASGTHAAVGANFYIIEGNLVQATETVAGTAKVATSGQITSGVDDETMVTPLKLQGKVNAERSTSDGKYVRVDTNSQGLNSTQQGNARVNIGAADDTAVVHNTGTETIAGVKTFSSSPVVPTASPNDNSTKVASTAYADAAVTAGVAWGQKDW